MKQSHARALAIEPCIWIGGAAMGRVRALLATEIGWPVAPAAARIIAAFKRVVLRLETLQRRPRLNQCAVNREMLVRQQPFDPRLRQHRGEKFGGDLAIQQPVAVGRKARMVPHRVINPKPDKPSEQQIEFDPLHQLPLRAHRIEGLQQHCPQQLFRWDRGPTQTRIQSLKLA